VANADGGSFSSVFLKENRWTLAVVADIEEEYLEIHPTRLILLRKFFL
jgi:hypothetical protein